MRGFPSNSFNVFEVVGFGAFYSATHSTFHVKKHPTYVSLMEEGLSRIGGRRVGLGC
jgi:hypothetical protein